MKRSSESEQYKDNLRMIGLIISNCLLVSRDMIALRTFSHLKPYMPDAELLGK